MPISVKEHVCNAIQDWVVQIMDEYGIEEPYRTDLERRMVGNKFEGMDGEELDDYVAYFIAFQTLENFGYDEDGVIQDEWNDFQEQLCSSDWLKGLPPEPKALVDYIHKNVPFYKAVAVAFELMEDGSYE
jgi:hypothetical protein